MQAAESSKPFIGLKLIDELRTVVLPKLDLGKLIRMCEELNECFARQNYLACALLIRAAMNHIPLVFGFRTFKEVVANRGSQERIRIAGRRCSYRYVDQIVAILDALARDRIAGLVRIERALHQLDERLLDRIFARAAQHRVFENMGDAGGIRRRGCKTYTDYLVFVAIDQREQLGTGLYVPVVTRLGFRPKALPDLEIIEIEPVIVSEFPSWSVSPSPAGPQTSVKLSFFECRESCYVLFGNVIKRNQALADVGIGRFEGAAGNQTRRP